MIEKSLIYVHGNVIMKPILLYSSVPYLKIEIF